MEDREVVHDVHSSYPEAMLHDKPVRKPRGFATMSPERRAEISSRGGKAAHERGTAHHFTSETARAAALKQKSGK